VLFALREEIGTPAFEQLERAWVRKYRDGVASTGDFIALASRVAGRDLGPFLRAWLCDAHTPPMANHPDWTGQSPAAPAARAQAQSRRMPLELLNRRR
jgi:aminopeptidase N